MARTEPEKKAQKKYYLKNKNMYKINSYRSRAKNFILKYATTDELIWLRGLIDERLSKKKFEVAITD
ncbi:hypothetical protein [Lactobacillus helveticus]|uniref:Uncharacterized protein n=1 Tax=Lactobacillus helveticus TaxID=1587 RepID=A0AAC8ZY67_LACHE|nr:hypothetical protein [Lactobacillus helveticus]ALI52291.1 hypothetical protein ALV80_03755 [Lactobacillus helveticus]NRO87427.1 hypothetical protein [Lactobacillus helveticus]